MRWMPETGGEEGDIAHAVRPPRVADLLCFSVCPDVACHKKMMMSVGNRYVGTKSDGPS